MQIAKSFRTVRKTVKVTAGRRAEISGLPFAPGSEVDVIVVGPATVKARNAGKSIYDYTESLTKSKRLPRYSVQQIEKIIHDSRLSRG